MRRDASYAAAHESVVYLHDRLEPAATSAPNTAAAGECATANRERGANHRNAAVDGDDTAVPSISARIAIVAVNYATTKNDTDHRSDAAADVDVAASASDRYLTCTTAGRRNRLRARAGKRSFPDWFSGRLDRSSLDFGAHVRLPHLDR